MPTYTLRRRAFLSLALAGLSRADEPVTYPAVSEDACPLEPIAPLAPDGHRGQGFLRKPPGPGPFPALLWIHGGLVTRPTAELRQSALGPNPSRFLAAGYVVAVITYRSRDHDPQSTVSLQDCLAAVSHLRRLPYLDPKSIVVFGCSGGGDLALEVAAATAEVRAIVPEEPATVLLSGIFNTSFPKKGERFTPADAASISEDPKRYYTPQYQKLTRAKIARIRCPILIVQGDQHRINHFNAEVLIPELRAAGKTFEVITYPGEPHCFAFQGSRRPVAALKAFRDADGFYRRFLPTKPKRIDAALLKQMPLVPSGG